MRLKLFAAALAFSTALSSPAAAGPLAFIPVAISALAGQALVGLGLSFAAASALVSAIGGLAISFALNFAINALFAPNAPRPQIQEAQANFLQSDAPRFLVFGDVRIGGTVMFAAVKDGRPHILVAHADSELTTDYGAYLQESLVTIDAENRVQTNDFTYDSNEYYRLYGRSGTPTQLAQQVLIDEFSEWTANHRGAGVADTLMVLDTHPPEAKQKLLRFSGSVGAGLPNVSRAGEWGRVYDPRLDSTNGGSGPQRLYNESTWGAFSGNVALLYAAYSMHPEGFAIAPNRIDWPNIIEQANYCDEEIIDFYGNTVKRYQIALPINKARDTRITVQDWILQACDGIMITNSLGQKGLLVGRYDPDPEVVLTDADIGDIERADGNDGENLSTHYFATYTDRNYRYKNAQTADFISPDFEVGDKIETKNIDFPQVPTHNQAYRLLAAAVSRQHEKIRLAMNVGLKGIRAKQARFVRLNLKSDPSLNGVYERAPINDPQNSISLSMVLGRCDSDRWNAVETKAPPPNVNISSDGDLENIAPAEMLVQPVQVQSSNGVSSVRLVASFPPPDRSDVLVQIQHRKVGQTVWEEFQVRAEDGAGTTGIVDDGSTYEYRWRTTTISGDGSSWEEFVTGVTRYTVAATADITPPGNLTATSVDTTTAGKATYKWTAPSSANYYETQIYRASGATAVFSSAIELPPQFGLPGQSDNYTENLSAGTYRAWMEPVNGSGVAGTRVGPITFTVT